MSHDDASELLGAYALDAVDGEELTELEAHLSACPRCRSELDSFREVARLLDQPEGTVKSRIRNGMRRMRTLLVDADAGVRLSLIHI